jgi:hypothetical protein
VPFSLPKNLNPRKIDDLSSLQRVASLFVVIAFIVLISWLVNTSKISSFYNAILPHNQTYTELAFNNVNNLPSTIPTDNQISFSFWVHNEEGQTYTYPYTITIESGNKTTSIKNGTFTLKSNTQRSIQETITIPSSSSSQQVSINLTSLKQSIDFWLKGNN